MEVPEKMIYKINAPYVVYVCNDNENNIVVQLCRLCKQHKQLSDGTIKEFKDVPYELKRWMICTESKTNTLQTPVDFKKQFMHSLKESEIEMEKCFMKKQMIAGCLTDIWNVCKHHNDVK
jgi:hypothetical protein